MKKVFSLFIIIVLAVFSLIVTANAATGDFTVNLSCSAASASAGDQITLSVSVSGINPEDGFSNVKMNISFDANAVEFVSSKSVAAPSSGWSYSASAKNGMLSIEMTDGSSSAPAKANGSLKATAVFKIKDGYAGSSVKFALSGNAVGAADSASYSGTSSGCTVNVLSTAAEQLQTPKNLIWSDMSASWSDIENADSYSVRLYRDGKAVGSAHQTSEASFDFSDIITATGSYTFRVTAIGSGIYSNSAEAKSTAFEYVSDPGKLSAPAGLAFTNALASWKASDNAGGYVVALYKDGKASGSSVKVTGLSYDFSDTINESGSYTFKVKAVPKADSAEYAESAYSAASPAYVFNSSAAGKLETASVAISENTQSGGLTYVITDSNDESSVKNYILYFYQDGSETEVYSVSVYTTEGYISCDGKKLVNGTKYQAAVKVVSEDKAKYQNSDISAESDPAVARDVVTGIAVISQPKLKYEAGDRVDLSELEVRITYGSGSTVDVGIDDFEKYNVTSTYDDGAVLSTKSDTVRITIRCGGKSTTTGGLSVEGKDECEHKNTTEDRKEPTCVDNGYLKVVCSDCGEEISNEVLQATGVHTFGEWTVVKEATSDAEGLRTHTCSVCSKTESEAIPIATTPVTDAPDSTEAVTQAAGSDAKSGLSQSVLIIIMLVLIAAIIADVVAIIIVRRKMQDQQ